MKTIGSSGEIIVNRRIAACYSEAAADSKKDAPRAIKCAIFQETGGAPWP